MLLPLRRAELARCSSRDAVSASRRGERAVTSLGSQPAQVGIATGFAAGCPKRRIPAAPPPGERVHLQGGAIIEEKDVDPIDDVRSNLRDQREFPLHPRGQAPPPPSPGTPRTCFSTILELQRRAVDFVQLFSSYPGIWVPGLILLVVLLCATLGSLLAWSNAAIDILRTSAVVLSKEVANDISHQFDIDLAPLYTLRNYVKQLPEFNNLARTVGNEGEPGAAPVAQGIVGYRNFTGMIGEGVTNLFNQIAAELRSSDGSGRSSNVVMTLQLLPKGVVTLVYPLKETKTLANGNVVAQDNTGAIGLDLINHPDRKANAEQVVRSDGPVVSGPQILIQQAVKALIINLPVNIPGESIPVQGEDYACWGFVTGLINWEQFLEEAGIYTRFKNAGMLFSLSKRELEEQPDGTFTEKVTKLAQSKEMETLGTRLPDDQMTISVTTVNDEWELAFGYENGFTVAWLGWTILLSVSASLAFSFLFMYALVNREHQLLLYRMMPRSAIAKIQRGEHVCEKYDQVTIFFSDIIGFTSMVEEMTPIQVMSMLNQLYTIFDALVEKHDVYKVETIGDAYMVLGGAPNVCSGAEGAEKVARFALAALDAVRNFRKEDGTTVRIRCGLASGPVVAGVIGRAMPRYDLFGDTVCFASRMESTSKAMRIQVAELTYFLLRNAQKSTFNMTLRLGPDGLPGIQVKGKGRVTTYWIDGVQGEADCVSPDTSAHASIAADLPPVTDTTASTLRQAAAALVLDGPASDFLLTRPSSVLTAGAGRATSANSGGVDEIQDVVDGPAYGALNRSSSAASQGLRLSSRERDHKVAEVNGPASGPVEVVVVVAITPGLPSSATIERTATATLVCGGIAYK